MSDWKWGDQFGADDDDDNEEEGGFQPWQIGQRDGLIFLIDVTKPMFQKEDKDDDTSPFELCIKCAKNVIQNKIISSEKDLLGVVFFGTKEDKNPSDFKNIYILHDLDQPGAQRVLQLEDFLNEEGNNDFENQYGHNDGFSISDALWTCSNMFSNCTQKLNFKRVMLFTNNDNPHSNNAQLRRQAAAKAEDLHQNGIDIELMHINPAGGDFNVGTFYKDILFPDEDETAAMPDPAEKFDDLLTRVRAKDHKKRTMARIPFALGKDLSFSIGVYTLVRHCNTPSRVRLYKKTNEEVKGVTRTYQEETGEILMPQDMKKSQVYAGRQICFENEEVKEIKKFDDSGLLLMGFKPASSVKRYYHVRPSQFIYPDETNMEGSTTVFTALLRKCLDRSMVAICRYIPRRNTPPRFVALMPQDEEVDEHNVQTSPPGFHVLSLPFADDIRKLKFEDDMPRANTEQVDKAKELVKKLQFTFRPESFENPALQKHYANVEAMALDRDEPEEITDYTMPDQGKMEKRAGRLLQEFKDLVFPADYVPGAKRKTAGGGAAAKKPKIEVEVDIEKEARAGQLGKLTVPVLKEYIKKHKIQSSGQRKADLIDAISDHFGL